ncbi:MAG: hypothetical protein H5U02_10210 [Clostridia bacterium]|nr:hypothetical protein [Clostridia bacterium]
MDFGFMATGIGSLPYTEPELAVGLIFKYMPNIPHWPQLPRRGTPEHFVHQYLNPLLRLGILEEDTQERVSFTYQSQGWENRLVEFYNLWLSVEGGSLEALELFALPEAAAPGFYRLREEVEGGAENATISYLKGQIAGPLSMALNLKDNQGKPAYYSRELRDLVVKATALQALWQATSMAKWGFPVMIFVDDPAIGAYGSANYISISRADVLDDLKTISNLLRQTGTLVGLHSCASIDWTLPIEANFSILAVDAYHFFIPFSAYAAALKAFVEQGGIIAWGIVPTSEEAYAETSDTLVRKLKDEIQILVQLGISQSPLERQSLITPSCGTGALPVPLAQHVYSLTADVSRRLQMALAC